MAWLFGEVSAMPWRPPPRVGGDVARLEEVLLFFVDVRRFNFLCCSVIDLCLLRRDAWFVSTCDCDSASGDTEIPTETRYGGWPWDAV